MKEVQPSFVILQIFLANLNMFFWIEQRIKHYNTMGNWKFPIGIINPLAFIKKWKNWLEFVIVFGLGMNEVELIDIQHKSIYQNSFIRERFATFFHEGVKYIRKVTKKESWMFD